MEAFEKILTDGMNKFDIELNEIQLAKFKAYCQLLLEWNRKFNLTAIKEPNEIAIKHFVDSCTILHYVNIKQNAKIIDVGTGAGFPGIPLKIIRDDIEITLLDSLSKRIVFLNEAAEQLGISVSTIHGRAEDLGRNESYRQSFDIAVSRAVAPLNVLSEYCIPLVRKGGKFISMKGPNVQEETDTARKGVKILGGRFNNIVQFRINDNGRSIVIVDKVSDTPFTYPRHGSKISKKPL